MTALGGGCAVATPFLRLALLGDAIVSGAMGLLLSSPPGRWRHGSSCRSRC